MRRNLILGVLALLSVAVLGAGCQPGLPNPTPIPTPAPTPGDKPSAVVPAEAQDAVALARADLARHLGLVTETAIAVTSVEAMDWPSTALGCPQPGVVYAQIITPGYQIVLAARGDQFTYHTDSGATVVLCETK
ncbi:MAG: hypothetical protein KKA73_20655 [Chloroflexi bacterium]|nr:hypothetical protein [Chloroflexota bacterium]MBU1750102.1 hypothetical protein [Chloroflexota bacterium]MBU1879542.1 hypothetical protein [Chloroflexota bacterium]